MFFKQTYDCHGKVFVSREAYERAGVKCSKSDVEPVVSLKIHDQYREMCDGLRRIEQAACRLEDTARGYAASGACEGERARVLQCYEARAKGRCTNCTQPVEDFVRCVRQLGTVEDCEELSGQHRDLD